MTKFVQNMSFKRFSYIFNLILSSKRSLILEKIVKQ